MRAIGEVRPPVALIGVAFFENINGGDRRSGRRQRTRWDARIPTASDGDALGAERAKLTANLEIHGAQAEGGNGR